MNELLLKNAADKLRREMRSVNTSEPATLIQEKVAAALDIFCKQESKLAEAIIKSDKTFADCCKSILCDTKEERYISDEKAYARAVQFYIPDAEIEFSMTIKTPSGTGRISLIDLLKV